MPEAAKGLSPALIAAFAILLARYADQTEVTLSLGRADARSERTSPRTLRLGTSPQRTGRELVAEARELASDRVASEQEQLAAAGGETDLSLRVAGADRRNGELVYDANLFERSSIERIAGHLLQILTALSTSPDAPLSRLPLLSPHELRWIESVCDGPTRSLEPALVHELFTERVRAAPEATALRFGALSLSYRELDQRASSLAGQLLEREIGRNCHVVVSVEPSFDIVIALLGILKAGAVYVPLDPSYPAARVQSILQDTQPSLVITQPHLQTKFAEHARVTTVADLLASIAPADEPPSPRVDPEQPAYVFYTSGTTGKPKGVVATQANLRHYVRSVTLRYELGSADVVPAIARFGFSISLFELLAPLIAGGTLLLLEREHVMEPARMARTLSEVTLFHAGPSLLKGLIAYIRQHYRDFSAFSKVRHASAGGDMVPPELLDALQEVFSNAEVFVIYGSSEISCMGCTYPVPRGRAVARTYVGRPFDNVVVRVLDTAGNVLPAGVVGEIHFAGAGVVSGYLNQPQLTAEKFVELNGRRFYRTGDQGRLDENGWLEFLGRKDFQVKLRGMRVELAEVEHALRRAPGVRDAVTATRDSSDGEKTLVAYVVTDGAHDKAQRIAAIRRHMAELLPDYMVPGVYVELERLPVNHNMKLDRRALPAPQEADWRAGAGAGREPRTPTEQQLALLWKQLLGVERVSIDDNFFELGGYSLLAMKLSLETEKVLGVPVDGMDVLREPLSVLAAICDRRLGQSSAPPTRPAARVDARADPAIEIFHFGSDHSLYGVLHGRAMGSPAAVLLCPPIGQEHVRARFVLTRLARRLSAAGTTTFMFDYFGCGDSLGDSYDAGPARWQADIVEAHAELNRRTGGAKIAAIGVRLGALLLSGVGPRLELSRIVLWDPVEDGADHRRTLEAMQRAYARSVAPLRWWRALRLGRARRRDLLGTIYSERALLELDALRLTLSPGDAGCPVERVDFSCPWHDLAGIEDVIADTQLSARLAELVQEPR